MPIRSSGASAFSTAAAASRVAAGGDSELDFSDLFRELGGLARNPNLGSRSREEISDFLSGGGDDVDLDLPWWADALGAVDTVLDAAGRPVRNLIGDALGFERPESGQFYGEDLLDQAFAGGGDFADYSIPYAPDVDTILGIGTEILLDPLTYVGGFVLKPFAVAGKAGQQASRAAAKKLAGEFLAEGAGPAAAQAVRSGARSSAAGAGIEAALRFIREGGGVTDELVEAGGFEFAERAPAASRRLSRDQQTEELLDRFLQLQAAELTGLSDEAAGSAASAIVSSIREGKLPGLRRAAARGEGGLTPVLLDDLGVGRGPTFAGRELGALSQSAGSVLESLAEAYRGVSIPLGGDAVAKLPTPLRFQDWISQSAIARFVTELEDHGLSAFDAYETARAARSARHRTDMLVNSIDDSVRQFITRTGRSFDDDTEKMLRGFIHGGTSGGSAPFRDLIDEFLVAAKRAGINIDQFNRAARVGAEAADDTGYLAAVDRLAAEIDAGVVAGTNTAGTAVFAPVLADVSRRLLEQVAELGLARPRDLDELWSYSRRQGSGEYVLDVLGGTPVSSFRSLYQGIATVDVLKEARRLANEFGEVSNELVDEALRITDEVGRLGDDWTSVETINESLAALGLNREMPPELRQVLTKIERTMGIGDEFDGFIEGSGLTYGKAFAERKIREAYTLLMFGDYDGLRGWLQDVERLFDQHVKGYQNLVLDRFVSGMTKAEIEGIGRMSSAAGLVDAARAMTDDELIARVQNIMRTQWYRRTFWDDWGRDPSQLRGFPTRQRVFLAVAQERGLGEAAFEEGMGMLENWKEIRSELRSVRAVEFPVVDEAARQAIEGIQDFHSLARILNDFYGSGADEAAQMIEAGVEGLRDAVGKGRSGGVFEQMGLDEAKFRDAVSSLRMQRGGKLLPSLGGNSKTAREILYENEELRQAAQALEDTRFAQGAGQLAADVIKFQENLKKAQINNESLDKVFQRFAATNRLFKRMYLFNGNYLRRNMFGQIRLNHLDGVRLRHYREWTPLYNKARDAISDELKNGLPERTSKLWADIPKANRALAQEIMYSGPGSSSGVGFAFGRATELAETAIGPRSGRVVDWMDRAKAKYEQLFVWTYQRAGTVSRERPLGESFKLKEALWGDGSNYMLSMRAELESFARTTSMWAAMAEQGKTLDGALLQTAKSHFDYWDLTESGQLLDELMPFYVFRSRITALALNNALGTPGLPAAVSRIQAGAQREDPWGVGHPDFADKRYFFAGGAGLGGVGWAFDFADPIAEGLGNVQDISGLLTSVFGGDAPEAFQEQVYQSLSPLAAIPLDPLLGIATSADGIYEDQLRPAAYYDGIGPRLVSALGSTPGFPLTKILEFTGQVQVIEGETYLTRNGANWLREMVPILSNIEPALDWAGFTEGQRDRPEDSLELQTKTWQAAFNVIGFPFKLLSPEAVERHIRNARWDVAEYDRLLSYMDDLEGGGNWWENTIGSG